VKKAIFNQGEFWCLIIFLYEFYKIIFIIFSQDTRNGSESHEESGQYKF